MNREGRARLSGAPTRLVCASTQSERRIKVSRTMTLPNPVSDGTRAHRTTDHVALRTVPELRRQVEFAALLGRRARVVSPKVT